MKSTSFHIMPVISSRIITHHLKPGMIFHFMSTNILNIFLMKKSQKEVLFQIFLLTKKKKGSFDPQSGQVLLCYCALRCMFLTSSSHRKYFITK